MTRSLTRVFVLLPLLVGCRENAGAARSRLDPLTSSPVLAYDMMHQPGAIYVTGTPGVAVGASDVVPEAPGVEVHCNGIDEDGDGMDACLGDADGDGDPADFDCDDGDPSRSSRTAEIYCDGIDQNCDGRDQCDRDGDGVDDAWDCDPMDPAITIQCLGDFSDTSSQWR